MGVRKQLAVAFVGQHGFRSSEKKAFISRHYLCKEISNPVVNQYFDKLRIFGGSHFIMKHATGTRAAKERKKCYNWMYTHWRTEES